MEFLGREGHFVESALWNRKPGRGFARTPRVLIVNADVHVAESMVLLLGLKGYPSKLATNQLSAFTVLDKWRPQFLFIDTRVGLISDHNFVPRLAQRSHLPNIMVIAMSGSFPEESQAEIQDAGYDGHLRKPCPIWQMADFLNNFFTCG